MDFSAPDVSVIVVAYNEAKNIERCLCSINNQRYQGSVRVILIDNASSDDTVLRAAEFSDITIYRRMTNNLGAARQDAVNLANTELVAFLDADCEADPNWLTALVAGISNLNETFAAVGGPFVFVGGESSFSKARALLQRNWLGHLGAEQIDHGDGELQERRHLPTANVLFRRSAVLAVGGFSHQFDRVGEDLNLSGRLVQAGYKLAYVSKAKALHHQRDGWILWSRRVFLYGRSQADARAVPFWRWPNRLRFPIMIAPLWVILSVMFTPIFKATLLVYALVCVYSFRTHFLQMRVTMTLWLMLVITHLSYGLGLFTGLLVFLTRAHVAPAATAEKWSAKAGQY